MTSSEGVYRTIDLVVFAIANLVNLLMIAIFLSRTQGWKRVERVLGIVLMALAIPTALAAGANIIGGREWWTIVLPALLVLFLALELVLDYILKLNFRQTRLLGPYLLLYYLALMGMIGYSFLIGRPYGFVTLVTYFLQLAATWYSYSKVGHG
jgi:hypothetical protein